MSRTNACDRRRLVRLVEMDLIALYRRVNALGSEGENDPTPPLSRTWMRMGADRSA